jgi:DNA-binding NtrC family response regulator
VRGVTVRTLVRSGYRVTAAENATKALEVLSSEPVSLLLTDVIMPGISGPELVARAQMPGLRVLYMSGYVGEALAAQGLMQEGINFLSKPFQASELLDHIQRSLKSETKSRS